MAKRRTASKPAAPEMRTDALCSFLRVAPHPERYRLVHAAHEDTFHPPADYYMFEVVSRAR
jgi:hypothetical protein